MCLAKFDSSDSRFDLPHLPCLICFYLCWRSCRRWLHSHVLFDVVRVPLQQLIPLGKRCCTVVWFCRRPCVARRHWPACCRSTAVIFVCAATRMTSATALAAPSKATVTVCLSAVCSKCAPRRRMPLLSTRVSRCIASPKMRSRSGRSRKAPRCSAVRRFCWLKRVRVTAARTASCDVFICVHVSQLALVICRRCHHDRRLRRRRRRRPK